MVAPDVLTDWLLESLETMAKNERSAVAKSTEEQKRLAAKALVSAIEQFSPFPGDKELVAAAGISTTILWEYRENGFTPKNKKLWKLAAVLGVDPKALIRGQVVKVSPSQIVPDIPKESDVISDVRQFIGTPKESLIREYLKALKAGG